MKHLSNAGGVLRAGIFGSDYQPGKQQYIQAFFERLLELNAEIWVENHFYFYLNQQFGYTPQITGLIDSETFPLDMAFSLGGDGTFLKTAAWVGRQNIPILGVNTGRLGFLADIQTNEINTALDEIICGNYRIEERSLLSMESTRFHEQVNYALNEIAVLKRDISSMITIQAYLNNEFLAEYLGDGLLAATPTGSTAYSLSVNGPVIIPSSNSFVLSPVAPHSLNIRPLVIPESYKIRLKVESRSPNFLVALDGRSSVFPSGSELFIQKADFTIRVVKRFNQNFYETLRNKLLWGTQANNKPAL